MDRTCYQGTVEHYDRRKAEKWRLWERYLLDGDKSLGLQRLLKTVFLTVLEKGSRIKTLFFIDLRIEFGRSHSDH